MLVPLTRNIVDRLLILSDVRHLGLTSSITRRGPVHVGTLPIPRVPHRASGKCTCFVAVCNDPSNAPVDVLLAGIVLRRIPQKLRRRLQR